MKLLNYFWQLLWLLQLHSIALAADNDVAGHPRVNEVNNVLTVNKIAFNAKKNLAKYF